MRQLLPIQQLEVKVVDSIKLSPESRYVFLFDRTQVSVAQLDRVKKFLPAGSLIFRVDDVNHALKAYEIVEDKGGVPENL